MYFAEITDTKTGETRQRKIPFEWGEGSEYWWSAGNMSCDCNRSHEFRSDGGFGPCGEGRYRVRCVDAGGRLLYEDDREAS